MKNKLVIGVVVVVLAIIGLYIGFQGSFQEKFSPAFKKSFRENFIHNCIGKDGSQETIDLCTCAADESISQLSVKELLDQNGFAKYIDEQILPKCLKNLELTME